MKDGGAAMAQRSFCPLPNDERCSGTGGPIGVNVFELIARDRENALLIGAHKVWERATFDVDSECPGVLVDSVGSEIRDTPLNDRSVSSSAP